MSQTVARRVKSGAKVSSVAPVIALLTIGSNASAETFYVAPTGTPTALCTRAEPCSLGFVASSAQPGDEVVLMDGTYVEPLDVVNSGTATDWITFRADECATPIVEGPGPGPNDDTQETGVGSKTASYLRFIGIVARGWNMGFGNAWTDGVPGSNGHWEIENCLSYSNTRTGFTFFSAEQFHLKNSISAHNGSSVLHSWSSGVTLYQTSGVNVVEGTVSFENTDAQKHTDGSGFIVDEGAHGALFVNNIAFRNGGSCLRLTKSHSTRFVNNTCYHNAQDPQADGPPNPSELYFTEDGNGTTKSGVEFINNVFVATGVGGGEQPIYNQPPTGWSNNVATTGAAPFFVDPVGANPNFTPSNAATELLGKALADQDVSTVDVGFDPQCIVKRPPTLVGNVASASWWQHDVDIDYIRSIGGVKGCFNPKSRASSDIGAYAAGAVTTITPGSCVPTVDPVTPSPVTPSPATPNPVTPGPVTPSPGSPAPVSPTPVEPGATSTPGATAVDPSAVAPPPATSPSGQVNPNPTPAPDAVPGAVQPTPVPGVTAVTPVPTPALVPTAPAPTVAPSDSNGGSCSIAGPSRHSSWRAWLAMPLLLLTLRRRRSRPRCAIDGWE